MRNSKDGMAERLYELWSEKNPNKECLRCEKPFRSEHKANRLCDKCRELNEKIIDKTLDMDL